MLVRNEQRLQWLTEDAYIKEIGKIRSEIGEVEEIYEDYRMLLDKVKQVISMQHDPNRHSVNAIKYLNRGLKLLQSVENDFRTMTKTGKQPRRKPIPQLKLTGDIEQDIVRISDNFARVAVRVRNVGQSLHDIEKIPMDSIKKRLEQAYLLMRRGFVEFEKIME